MSIKKFHPLAVGCVLAVLVSVAPAVLGQVTTTNTQPTQATRDQSLTMRSVPAGSKMKFRGVVISRDADVFTIRDRTRQDYQVLITDNTSIKTNGGFLRSGKKYPVTDILRGLIVEVEGRGDAQGQLLAEAKQQLDELAAKTSGAKAFMIEVAGHTDATGSEAKNFRLSRARADAVVQYLAVQHKIPLRRFVTPMGYGKTEAVADNTTASGRQQNRRVEVKMIINRGLNQSTTNAARP